MHEYMKLDDQGLPVEYCLSIHDVRAAHPNVLFIEDGVDHSHLGYPLVEAAAAQDVRRWQEIRPLPPVMVDGRWIGQMEVYDLPISIDDKRLEIKRDADLLARMKRDQIVAGVSPAEMASWSIKRAEAQAYAVSNLAADAPCLAIEAQARGVDLANLVGKVLGKSTQLAALEAAIAGRCGAIQDAAAVAQSDAELLAIDLEAGWPV